MADIPLATSETTGPILAYPHTEGRRAVIALVAYRQADYPNDASFPSEFDGTYFFADFYNGPIRNLRLEPDGGWTAVDFATGFGRAVDGAMASDGGIYILEYGSAITKIAFRSSVVGSEPSRGVPGEEDVTLAQNYPNPFSTITQIGYRLSSASPAAVAVYNVIGERVATLLSRRQGPGQHTVKWDGRDDAGILLPNGVYFYRLEAGNSTETRKMLLMR